jgi:hypothetical protein
MEIHILHDASVRESFDSEDAYCYKVSPVIDSERNPNEKLGTQR